MTLPPIPADTVLEDDRVLMRLLQPGDNEHLLHFAKEQPNIWHYSLISGATEAGMKHYISIASDGHAAGHSFPFIVYDKKTNSYAGSTRFYDIQPELNTLQLGYTWYGQEFQGTGLNRHCKMLLLQFAFETLGIERVEFRADNENARSIAAMKAIGCRVDGVLRANMPKPPGQTGRRDSIVLSILKEEWLSEIKAHIMSRLVTSQ
ncbi:MAG: GNAT family N-acetyltransferase [Chitinophagaceae bacterium]